jgi:hypothetical protein
LLEAGLVNNHTSKLNVVSARQPLQRSLPPTSFSPAPRATKLPWRAAQPIGTPSTYPTNPTRKPQLLMSAFERAPHGTARAQSGEGAYSVVGQGAVPFHVAARFAYVLDLDGITASTRLPKALATNSPVLKQVQ